LLPGEYLGTAGLVASTDAERRRGHEWLLGLQRQMLRVGAYLQAQGASPEFRQLGQTIGTPAIRLQVAGNLTYTPPGRFGTFGIGFANLARYGEQAVRTLSATYSKRIGEKSSLVLTASRALAGVSGNSVSANLLIPLEGGLNVGSTVGRHDGRSDAYLTATSNPGGDGLGWRVLGGQQSSEQRAEANTYYQGRYGRLSADLSHSATQTASRVGASGGFVIASSQVFATRRVEDSYALVEIPGYKDVGVGLGSNVLTKTDTAGVALVPRLMAYQRNSIRVDPADLPISAELDSIEQTAVPSWRSAVLVKYPVRSGRGALLKIRFDDGEDAPAGATVRIEGDNQEFYVARRGEAFVTGLESRSTLRLAWRGKQCTFTVNLPAQDPNEIPRVGPLACQGVPR
ncbi:MAG TPA: fimbria/pilus outer membrane usher protein, partial [Ramlibacter sp.]